MLRATLVSLICNIILVAIKTAALIVVNSLAIAVDLGISFVGLMVSGILYYSIKLANRPADLSHNYGYGKVEHVCEALEGVVLIGIALALSVEALLHLFHPRDLSLPFVGLTTSIINAALNFGGAWYIFKMAKKSASPAIYAEGVHYRLEGFISGMIGISFLVFMFLSARGMGKAAGFVDPAAALIASGMIVLPSFKLAKNAFFNLLDASVAEDSQIEILKHLTEHIDKYCEFKDIKTRTAGRNKFVEFKLIFPQEMSFREGHEIVDIIEKDIKAGIPNCEVNIKMQPCKRDCGYIKKGKACPYIEVVTEQTV